MSFLSGLGKVLGVGGSIASLIPGVGGLVGAGLGALGGAMQGSQKDASAEKLRQQNTDLAMARYKETAPARAKSLQLLMADQPTRPNLGAIFQGPMAGAYGRPRVDPFPAAAGGAGALPPPQQPRQPLNLGNAAAGPPMGPIGPQMTARSPYGPIGRGRLT